MTHDDQSMTCPICEGELSSPRFNAERGERVVVSCPNCGDREFSRSAVRALQASAYESTESKARLAYAVRKLTAEVLVTTPLLRDLDAHTVLPPALERIDNVVLYLALHEPGAEVTLTPANLKARLGASTAAGARWAIDQAAAQGLITAKEVGFLEEEEPTQSVHLTAVGWRRFAELTRAGVGSRHAFMAMRFGDAELDAVFASAMQPAVAQAGFDLRKVSGPHQTAGSIDDRMRVEIRTSRFMVCDLTHGNRGAYWESGFAEGLGRPVFYTCRRNVLNDKQHEFHPHFDTAHQLITAWSPDTIDADMQTLKNAIRATLPAEAKMED